MSRFVLVTGASRGIGRAIAIQLAQDGFDIVIHCRSNIKKAQETADQIKELGRESRILSFDISNRAQCKEFIEKDMLENGAYYGVVCNAGICKDTPFPAMEGEQWDAVIDTNLNGFYNVLQPIIMPMVRKRIGGRIVTLSSVSGVIGNRGQVNYSAAKSGIIGATKALAMEMAKRKITVNCVAPGIIDTEMSEGLDPEIVKQIVPMRRSGTVEEVSHAVSFLFSDKASYITRQVISVNGGMA
ncbi:MAG: 3-oxoacyl-ACP reductase FabG [Lentisphaeraceae bacterium]|nr:3-oxoacyl-ACP reductase FabG [Lentisphaeraceae bacterium]